MIHRICEKFNKVYNTFNILDFKTAELFNLLSTNHAVLLEEPEKYYKSSTYQEHIVTKKDMIEVMENI